MKFGPVATLHAAGHVLAHSMQAKSSDTQSLYRIAKGTLLNADHVQDLSRNGHAQITVAQLGPYDVEENAAATQLARAIAPDAAALGLRLSVAGAGRVNIYALHAGVAVLDEDAIHQLNAIDPMITLATVAPLHRVDAGTMVATIKIIAYAVCNTALSKAKLAAVGALKIAMPAFATATLIETQVSNAPPSSKGRDALGSRLDRLGLALSERVITAHQETALADAIQSAPGAVIFILTASATSDSLDVGPQALRHAGGQVTGFGLPVDPGNLLFFGTFKDRPVIGLPGCARSPALNGADWVLERLICGLGLSQNDVARMGVGGLLKEIPTRPQPRSLPVKDV